MDFRLEDHGGDERRQDHPAGPFQRRFPRDGKEKHGAKHRAKDPTGEHVSQDRHARHPDQDRDEHPDTEREHQSVPWGNRRLAKPPDDQADQARSDQVAEQEADVIEVSAPDHVRIKREDERVRQKAKQARTLAMGVGIEPIRAKWTFEHIVGEREDRVPEPLPQHQGVGTGNHHNACQAGRPANQGDLEPRLPVGCQDQYENRVANGVGKIGQLHPEQGAQSQAGDGKAVERRQATSRCYAGCERSNEAKRSPCIVSHGRKQLQLALRRETEHGDGKTDKQGGLARHDE